MSLKHLTDEQIQNYLDRKDSNHSQVHSHLNDCSFCQEQIEQYANLYSELEKPARLNLSPNFADSVLARIQAETSESPAFQIWQILIPFLGFAAGLGMIFYFLGFKSLADLLAQVEELPKFVGEILVTIGTLFSGIEMNYGLLGLGIFSLILLSGLDYFLFKSKGKIYRLKH